MAIRNFTGNCLARATARLRNTTFLAQWKAQATINQATAWLATERNFYRVLGALFILGFVVAISTIKANPLHPINQTVSSVGVCCG